jgi:phospholipid/cholesterol/gamma-HCH transport system permease protein
MSIKAATLKGIPYSLGFFVKTLKSSLAFGFRGHVSFKILIMQILFTFVEAMGITSLLALGLERR